MTSIDWASKQNCHGNHHCFYVIGKFAYALSKAYIENKIVVVNQLFLLYLTLQL